MRILLSYKDFYVFRTGREGTIRTRSIVIFL
jgi:hypothetical protein